MCINERMICVSAKEQLMNILDFIDEKEANRILLFIKESFLLKSKTWDDIEEDDPMPEELAVFEEYRVSKS
jgi:hypothetical protein